MNKDAELALPLLHSHSLVDRTFKTLDFYRKHQDNMTPAGLAFFQCQWDESVTNTFHNTLGESHRQKHAARVSALWHVTKNKLQTCTTFFILPRFLKNVCLSLINKACLLNLVPADMREPVFEFIRPPVYHPPQVRYPHGQPLRYLDRYRDGKEHAYGIYWLWDSQRGEHTFHCKCVVFVWHIYVK